MFINKFEAMYRYVPLAKVEMYLFSWVYLPNREFCMTFVYKRNFSA